MPSLGRTVFAITIGVAVLSLGFTTLTKMVLNTTRIQPGPYKQFILFGDSLTQQSHSQELGFASGAALQDAFIRRLDVINRGFSGYNTDQALVALPQFMPDPTQANVRIMYIFFGANDACLETSPTGQYVPLTRFASNLEKMALHPSVQAHRTLHNAHLFLVTPPPVNEYQFGDGDPFRTAENTKKYADACREVGSKLQIPVLDLWGAVMREVGWVEGDELIGSRKVPESAVLKSMLRDGLHFTPPTYKMFYREIMSLIKTEWPDDDPDSIPFILPVWTKGKGFVTTE